VSRAGDDAREICDWSHTMSQLAETIVLGPEEEATRLWQGAREAFEKADQDLVSLCESLDLGIRAAEILIVQRLQPVKGDFPATIGLLLETPVAEVDTFRDSVSVPSTLQFTDIVDLLSAEGLKCTSPGLHRGWEDRRFACARSRVTAQGAVGVALDKVQREHLLLLAAYRNRIFRYPPPVRIVPKEILSAFAALDSLVRRMLDQ
jgi:hypothetical protein